MVGTLVVVASVAAHVEMLLENSRINKLNSVCVTIFTSQISLYGFWKSVSRLPVLIYYVCSVPLSDVLCLQVQASVYQNDFKVIF